ncbi:hypothetical protein [Methylobacterium sp. PvR107]|uniref:hypothetical protein n=1 Tax=Methylobacterium sp. PvR107 TaxID=2806597 RepID=UPI001AE2FD48|nr:hypothetical protein [Methylobacterium sp. PvR107]MBP1183090.1 asparagine N-glycosylation enzyme membrane subunit Stt3 [Methylobacterium sp. PvR107]
MTSLVETLSVRRAEAGRSPFESPLLIGMLVLVALFGLYDPRNLIPVFDGLRLPDTDDMMRLVGVRDLLAGQGWFDPVQHRMLPPAGIASHWSRLIDLPLAALILALTPLIGRELAEPAAAALWPLMLFVLYGALAFLGMRRLFGWRPALLTLFIAPQTGVFLNTFRFGRIDHHNAQLCAVLAVALALARSDRPVRRGLVAGLVAGLSLAIGLETLPVIAAAGLFVVADWVLHGARASGRLTGFGAGLFAASVLLFGAQTAPALWTVPACDALSPPWLLLAAGGALAGVAALAADRRGLNRNGRATVAALVGAAVAAGFVLIAPACLAGPFAGMDARVRTSWLERVDEMRSFLQVLRGEPDVALANIVPLIAAALYATVMAIRVHEPERRRFFLAVATVMWPGTLVALVQVRGMYVAGAFVPLMAALALDRAMLIVRENATILRRLLVLALPLTMMGKVWAIGADVPMRIAAAPGTQPAIAGTWTTCTEPTALAALGRLPTGLVLSEIDLGPAILLRTGHSIVAAPYHRNLVGLRAAIEAFEGSQAVVREVARDRGADYLVLCTLALEPGGPDKPQPFATGLARGSQAIPDWLEPVGGMPGGSPLRVWRIRRE